MVKVVSASRKGLQDISGTFVKLNKKETKEIKEVKQKKEKKETKKGKKKETPKESKEPEQRKEINEEERVKIGLYGQRFARSKNYFIQGKRINNFIKDI